MINLIKLSLITLSFILSLPAFAVDRNDLSCEHNDKIVPTGETISLIKAEDAQYWSEYKKENGHIPDGAYTIWKCVPIVTNPSKPEINRAAWIDASIK